MKIAFFSSEVAPFSKTGGLADVSGTLPQILAAEGHEVVVVTPLYACVDRTRHGLRHTSGRGEAPGLGGAEIWEGTLGAGGRSTARVLFLSAAAFDRANLYQETGRDYPDNDVRFSYFSRAALLLLKHVSFAPDVIHANDWQTALVPVYLKTHFLSDEFFSRCGTVLSIHNLAYQGVFEADRWRALGLPDRLFRMEALEFYGKINLLKGGLVFSDILSTVSPRYAREIQTQSNGAGLDGVLQSRAGTLVGILNGIEYADWDPSRDDNPFPPYGPERMAGKSTAKKILLEQFGLDSGAGGGDPAPALLGSVTRLDPQKGCDILLRGLFHILPRTNARFVMLGSGARDLEAAFANLARQFPGRVGVALKFDPKLAKLVYAGSDLFLMPSKYEPCGLGQMIAMAYGTVPVVRLTGGLADTVRPYDENSGKGNGFGFESYTAEALSRTVQRALHIYRQKSLFSALQQNALRERFTWGQAARSYLDVYSRAIRIRAKGGE
ncbi:MAG: hypothetical protein A3G34_00320 [Candidatus Lindowbacteria bacterium RIFCSPLOWO2_12_FULL_62_27]|nr:MAG: hypothetical protein A3G34_00320 [Candidatus Lindowbacteria bacterium RIFCSPLOWO2_12_FULL_62_27]OGH63393.1 MAG: hypothetical protein A3I06_08400 [Candidatus Lindowbacteria bacterium RIFCSPLOWO2_02_FULL_62_12]